MDKKRIKNIIIRILTGAGFLFCICIVLLFLYRIFFFNNPASLSNIVPEDATLFISLNNPEKSFKYLEMFIPTNIMTKKVDPQHRDRALHAIGSRAAVFKRGSNWGGVAKISLFAKLALPVTGSAIGGSTSKITLAGNEISTVTMGKTIFYLKNRWNILAICLDKTLAADTAELLNTYPVISPLSQRPLFRELTGAPENKSLFFAENNITLKKNPFSSEFNKIQTVGGNFTNTPNEISGTVNIHGELTTSPPPAFPDLKEAFMCATFPCDIQKIWMDYCFTVQSSKKQYGSMQVSMTSDIFDTVITSLDKRLCVWAFPPENKNIYPTIVLTFKNKTAFSPPRLKGLLLKLAEQAMQINSERVRKYGATKYTAKLKTEIFNKHTIYFLKVDPVAIPNFMPGFFIQNRDIYIASYYPDLKKFIANDTSRTVSNQVYIRISDKRFNTTLGYLKKHFSNPSRKRRMGEASYSKWMDRLNTAQKYIGRIRSINIHDGKKAGPNDLVFSIKRVEEE